MRVCAQSSQRSTCPPSAAVRQLSIADMTFSWPRLTWPALALRHAGPWRAEDIRDLERRDATSGRRVRRAAHRREQSARAGW